MDSNLNIKSVSFIGGDNRNLLVSKMFKESKSVFCYGLDNNTNSLEECINSSKYIVVPIPFSTDNEHVYTPLCDVKLKIEDFAKSVSNKVIIGGMIKPKFAEMLQKNGNQVIDIMKDKELILKNTIPTAEGVVKIVIENTDITIDSSNIAVIGFGNVGKKVANTFKALNAHVFCYDISTQEVANIRSSGYNVIDSLDDSLKQMDVIVNTVPELILDKQKLDSIPKSTLIVDVASAPGGVDFEYAKQNQIKVIHALGLPGKVAPKTSAEYVKAIIEKQINK